MWVIYQSHVLNWKSLFLMPFIPPVEPSPNSHQSLLSFAVSCNSIHTLPVFFIFICHLSPGETKIPPPTISDFPIFCHSLQLSLPSQFPRCKIWIFSEVTVGESAIQPACCSHWQRKCLYHVQCRIRSTISWNVNICKMYPFP